MDPPWNIFTFYLDPDLICFAIGPIDTGPYFTDGYTYTSALSTLKKNSNTYIPHVYSMVLLLEGNSEIGAHVVKGICLDREQPHIVFFLHACAT